LGALILLLLEEMVFHSESFYTAKIGFRQELNNFRAPLDTMIFSRRSRII